jgi:hypothetical protein
MVLNMTLLPVNSYSSLSLPDQIIETDGQDFCSQFNRVPFQFLHNLAEHPLFEIPHLVELANSIALKHGKEKVSCLSSNVSANQKWSDMSHKEQVAEAIAHIEESGSLVLIRSAHLEPDFCILMNQILTELEDLTKVPLRKEITWPEAYIFISSPNSVTPYHIDHESNFLFQICGEKEVHLFDPFDLSILTEQEIEQYFSFNLEAATYRKENQTKAHVYPLVPGKAVHHPSLAPHWVRNGANISVSLSINFCLRSIDLNARVYQVNHFLRKLGLQPNPPGKSPIKDKVKIMAIGAFAKRKPEIKHDVVFSGVRRLKEVLKKWTGSKIA